MDLENLYPLNRPYLSENRTKRTKNPFTYENVSGALGVILSRKKLKKVELSATSLWQKRAGSKDWELFSSWVEDTRNLPTVYRRLLALPAAGVTQGPETVPKVDALWAGNVTGLVWLALYTWDDGDEHMTYLRRHLKDYASGPQDDCTARLLASYIRKLNADGLQIIQDYEPTDAYCRRYRTFKDDERHFDDVNYRKALVVDTVAHVLATVKDTAPDLLEVYRVCQQVGEMLDELRSGMNEALLARTLQQAMTTDTRGNLRATAQQILSELRRADTHIHGSV